jgi:hypothetical protein
VSESNAFKYGNYTPKVGLKSQNFDSARVMTDYWVSEKNSNRIVQAVRVDTIS